MLPEIIRQHFILLSGESAELEHSCVELVILALPGDELFVIPTLNDVSVFENHYSIGVSYGGKSVGDYEYRSALHQAIHALFDECFRSCINGRCCFVKDKNGRVCHRCTGNCKELSLTL